MSDKLEILKTLNSVAVVTSPLAVGALVVGGTGGVISAIIGATTGVAWGTVITAVAAPLLAFLAAWHYAGRESDYFPEYLRRPIDEFQMELEDYRLDLAEWEGAYNA